ncbi:glycosyltransferase family 87 protein [Bradyrhizobium sp. A5]|uniref:glycosyltransferase family 87 protein n=1 Tax=Bradyrhizobium sp. A5 TaxID=3133696 RepID=UPI003247A4F7
MLAKTLEQIQSSPGRRATYVRCLLATLAAIVGFKTYWFFRWGFWHGHEVPDFAAFHLVAQRVWLGDLDLTYRFAAFMKMQAGMSGGATGFMPWTYPPQFDLLLAPFAFLPTWAAYFVFTAATLTAYLMTLRAIAREHFAQALVVLFPAMATTIGCGQNGFLTGALIGLVCINLQKRKVFAGLALGAMVVKPHLAIAVGVYLLATRRWATIVTAAIVVLVSSLLCTVAFGSHIWIAWQGAIRESAGFLEQGLYPLFRMISAYAALFNAGVPASAAFWGQVTVAGLALVAVVTCIARGMPPSFTLGVAATVSVMISPYAYDYDLPIVGIGLALLLPDLPKVTSPGERSIMYGLVMLAGAYGLLQSIGLAAGLDERFKPAIAGIALIALLAMLLRMLWRNAQPVTATRLAAVAPARLPE